MKYKVTPTNREKVMREEDFIHDTQSRILSAFQAAEQASDAVLGTLDRIVAEKYAT